MTIVPDTDATRRLRDAAEEASIVAWQRCRLLVPPSAWLPAVAATVTTKVGRQRVIYDPRLGDVFLPSAETTCCPEAWRRATTRDWHGENTHTPGCDRG